MKAKRKKIAQSAIILILISGLSCGPHIPTGFPQTSSCDFIVETPGDFECWMRHPTIPPASDQRKIKLVANVRTFYLDGATGKTEIDDKLGNYDPLTTSFPLHISALMATNKPTIVELTITGDECSECANGYGGGTSPNANCSASSQIIGGTLYYSAAKPRWASNKDYPTFSSSITLPPVGRIPNLPNSCDYCVH